MGRGREGKGGGASGRGIERGGRERGGRAIGYLSRGLRVPSYAYATAYTSPSTKWL